MKTYKVMLSELQMLTSKTCNKCGCKINSDQIGFMEWIDISFWAGYYNPAFEDGKCYKCDLCPNCIKEVLGKYFEVVEII